MKSKKTMATHSPSDAAAADKAAREAGYMVQHRFGRRRKKFDWSTVTPEDRAAAIAAYEKKIKQ